MWHRLGSDTETRSCCIVKGRPETRVCPLSPVSLEACLTCRLDSFLVLFHSPLKVNSWSHVVGKSLRLSETIVIYLIKSYRVVELKIAQTPTDYGQMSGVGLEPTNTEAWTHHISSSYLVYLFFFNIESLITNDKCVDIKLGRVCWWNTVCAMHYGISRLIYNCIVYCFST